MLVESFSLQCVRNERRKDGYLKARNKSVNLVLIAEIVCKKYATDKSEERGKQNYTFPVYLNLNLVYGKKDTTQSPSDPAYSRRGGLYNKV